MPLVYLEHIQDLLVRFKPCLAVLASHCIFHTGDLHLCHELYRPGLTPLDLYEECYT